MPLDTLVRHRDGRLALVNDADDGRGWVQVRLPDGGIEEWSTADLVVTGARSEGDDARAGRESEEPTHVLVPATLYLVMADLDVFNGTGVDSIKTNAPDELCATREAATARCEHLRAERPGKWWDEQTVDGEVHELDLRELGTDLLATYRALDARLAEFYTDDERALVWHRPHPQLEGRSAIEAVLSGDAEAVGRVLDRLEGGVYL